MRLNSNVIYKEYFFSLQTFSFFNNSKEIVEFFDEYNFALIKKKSHIKQLYNQILNKCNHEEEPITVFIPTVKISIKCEKKIMAKAYQNPKLIIKKIEIIHAIITIE